LKFQSLGIEFDFVFLFIYFLVTYSLDFSYLLFLYYLSELETNLGELGYGNVKVRAHLAIVKTESPPSTESQ
jgi:hypothetical protein